MQVGMRSLLLMDLEPGGVRCINRDIIAPEASSMLDVWGMNDWYPEQLVVPHPKCILYAKETPFKPF